MRQCIAALTVLALVFLLGGCPRPSEVAPSEDGPLSTDAAPTQAEPLYPDGQMTTFSYSWGGYPDASWEFRLTGEEGSASLMARGYNGADLDLICGVDARELQLLSEIIQYLELYNWNGFQARDDEVMDGYGFSLLAEWENGYTLAASGHERYPENYSRAHQSLSLELLDMAERYGEMQ